MAMNTESPAVDLTKMASTYLTARVTDFVRQGQAFVTFKATLSPAIVATVTVAESAALTVTGILTTDILIAIQKPTAQAGLGIAGGRINATNDLRIWFVNPSAGGITPTASEVYTITVLRTT